MPIKGLTDRGLAFPCIGKIRKGAPKTSDTAPGKDLDYFRVEFDEGESVSADLFKSIYGETPRSINVIFPPHQEMEDIASFWLEAYTAGRMVARSDGEDYQYLVDTKTGEMVVVNGLDIKTGLPRKYNPIEPCGFYTSSKRKEEVPIFCKPVGRLKVVVPELRRAVWLLAMTSSVHDCINLSAQIQAYLTDYGNIASIPFILKRTPRNISTPTSDKKVRARRQKWLMDIEVNPAWFGKMLDYRREKVEQIGSGKVKQIDGLNTRDWDQIIMEDEDEEEVNGMDQVAPAGDFYAEDKIEPEDQFPDLDLLSEKDPTTAFWHLTNRMGIDKETANGILKECGSNFREAYQRTRKTYSK